MGRGNQFQQMVKVLYSNLLTISKELQNFPHRVRDLNHRPQRSDVNVTTAPLWPLKLRGSQILR